MKNDIRGWWILLALMAMLLSSCDSITGDDDDDDNGGGGTFVVITVSGEEIAPEGYWLQACQLVEGVYRSQSYYFDGSTLNAVENVYDELDDDCNDNLTDEIFVDAELDNTGTKEVGWDPAPPGELDDPITASTIDANIADNDAETTLVWLIDDIADPMLLYPDEGDTEDDGYAATLDAENPYVQSEE